MLWQVLTLRTVGRKAGRKGKQRQVKVDWKEMEFKEEDDLAERERNGERGEERARVGEGMTMWF